MRESAEETTSTWGLLKCPKCPYTTTHKLSLNGHMNMHTTNPEEQIPPISPPKTQAQPTPENMSADRYCSDCDIQFSSLKTFRVHKAHYCQTRHVLKANKSPAMEELPPPTNPHLPSGGQSGQPILMLPTDPVLLVPYSVLIGASLLPSHVLPQQSAAVLTSDGQIQPLSLAHMFSSSQNTTAQSSLLAEKLTNSIPSLNNISPKVSPQSANFAKLVKKEAMSPEAETTGVKRKGDVECPLDLTTKRAKITLASNIICEEEKENRDVKTPTVVQSPNHRFANNVSITGEFEGKLLAASPQPSISKDQKSGESPKSPRPASAAPSLSSPRGPSQESPRPSTSTMNLSPNGSSIPNSVLHGLSTNIPHLLGNMDNIGSLSMANIQYLHQLQRRMSPDILANMFSTGMVPTVPTTPAAPVKHGEARCTDCNITFYKEQNYLVHKKHYCASREKTNDDDKSTDTSTCGSRGSMSPPNPHTKYEQNSNNSTKDSNKSSKASGNIMIIIYNVIYDYDIMYYNL